MENYIKDFFKISKELFEKRQFCKAIEMYNHAFEMAYKLKLPIAYKNEALESYTQFIEEKYTPRHDMINLAI